MDATRLKDGRVALTLSYAEAIVLSELLSRMERDQHWDRIPFADQAELRVILDLTATFEPVIDEVFSRKYDQVLDRARAEVRDPGE